MGMVFLTFEVLGESRSDMESVSIFKCLYRFILPFRIHKACRGRIISFRWLDEARIKISSFLMELILKLSRVTYVEVSFSINSPASMYHFLSIMVGPRFLSAGLITIS